MTSTLLYLGPSLRELHEGYAKQHRIDDRAPIRGHGEIVVHAPVARVWGTLSDVAAWDKNLEPGVHDIRLEQGVVVDAPFSRSNKGARMSARFAVVDKEQELAWTGSAFGAKVVHRFRIEPLSESSTRVTVEESMAGPLLAFVYNTAKLQALLDATLATLKSAAEAG